MRRSSKQTCKMPEIGNRLVFKRSLIPGNVFFKPRSSFDVRIIWIVFILFWPAMATSGSDPEVGGLCPQYVWIDCAQQSRHKNGALTQYYHIRHNADIRPNCLDAEDYKVLYRFRIRSKPKRHPYGFDLVTPKDGYYSTPIICDKDGLYFTIKSEGNNIVEVFVVVSCGRKQFLAHVIHPIFGKAPHEKPVQKGVAQLPQGLPRLRLGPKFSVRSMYMQTGRTYRFEYMSKDSTAKSVSIIENQQHMASLTVSDDGTFAYTPPHDPKLDRSGPYDYKQTVVLVEETGAKREYAATQTLLLHRSYTARNRLKPGLMLFGAVFLAVSLIVVFNRKYRWI